MNTLMLDIAEFTDTDHWRWVLTDAFKADHTVALERSDPNYPAFVDLYAYLRYHAVPDRRLEDEAAILERLGKWIGEQVLGPIGPKLIAQTPITVHVRLPAEAQGLLYRPLELAHVRGKPLALQGVSLVFELAGEAPVGEKAPIQETLRLLALFSLPTGQSILGLRQERHTLKQLIRQLIQTQRQAITLRILQYGVTREGLEAVLAEGEGWDLIHFSGHGLPAGLILEKPDGSPDPIPVHDLKGLLAPVRPHLKLITLSACESAAPTVQETLRWLHLDEPRRAAEPIEAPVGESPLPALAQTLAEELDCAVLAMRYPVGDEFAISLAQCLYELLLAKRCSLTLALQRALAKVVPPRPQPGVSPLSVATPALFGARAADLSLTPPRLPKTDFGKLETPMAYFGEKEPERFVGRTLPMIRASRALAPESHQTGVLFHGMAGAGKTTCALELAYRYEQEQDRFEYLVWHKAPDAGTDIEDALQRLALDMEKQLPGLAMIQVVDRAEDLINWLPQLSEILELRSLLIVLDNLESLLTPEGRWRDARWEHLINALLDHQGFSRTVLTSRIRPLGLNEDRVQIEPIHALSLEEVALLARQLPNLGKLLRGDGPVGLERGRALVNRTLAVVQGHPLLIEFAEGQAEDPKALEAHLERAARTWTGGEGALQAFFREGTSPFEARDFLTALDGWTRDIAGTLSPAARDLFFFLCCLEEDDRTERIVKANWSDLWRRLERTGEPPELNSTLKALTTVGLVAVIEGEGEADRYYALHPGVTEAGRGLAGKAFQGAVYAELAAYWVAVFDQGLAEEIRGGGFLVLAGRRAMPYLLRQEDWESAILLDEVLIRDHSPATAKAVLPWLRRIVESTQGTEEGLENAVILATALSQAGRVAEAETWVRAIIDQAEARGAFQTASAAARTLINLLKDTGHTQVALTLVERNKDLTRRADLGPWTQLSDEGGRLQLLNRLGRYEEVLEAVETQREWHGTLSEAGGQAEAVEPWAVREFLLNIGCVAAVHLERWEEALALNAEIVESMQARGAPAWELARNRFNDYYSLLSLERYEEARDLLDDCRAVFEAEDDVATLGKVFGALADLEEKLGHQRQAINFMATALRYSYHSYDPEDCAMGHFDLAYLMRSSGSPGVALAHRLAAGMIRFQTGSGNLGSTLQALADDLADLGPDPPLPTSFDELCERVETVEGVQLRKLFERLPRRVTTGDEALAEVIRLARELPKPGDQG